ncbi:MAG TPA: helix-turn-helix domain-containing protein [bacterium]|nr:helix-turn-helix domain-containing protein [bacterium]
MPKKDNIIKQVCATLGITQKALAKKIGLHEMTVSRWARGYDNIPQWAEVLFSLMLRESKNDEVAKKALEISDLIKKTFADYKS